VINSVRGKVQPTKQRLLGRASIGAAAVYLSAAVLIAQHADTVKNPFAGDDAAVAASQKL
jgi:hypothetical protein